MKVFAHVRADGSIQGLVAAPEGKLTGGLTPAPGVQVCEIADHGLKGERVDHDALARILSGNSVEMPAVRGKLTHRKK